MSKLKPCPFCGGEAQAVNASTGWYVECLWPECYGWYPRFREISEGAAVDAWNRRPPEGVNRDE